MCKRIQRTRVKGYRMPENAVSIARPGRYGNPYKIGDRYYNVTNNTWMFITRENCLKMFETYVRVRLIAEPEWLEPLRDKDLACFCKTSDPCHGDVLLRFARKGFE